MVKHTCSRKNEFGPIDEQIDPAMINFWGKNLSGGDFQICKTLGWIVEQRKGTPTVWCPIEEIRAFEGKIHRKNSVTNFVCDDLLREFTIHNTLACLDPYLGTKGRRPGLRLLLTLVSLYVSGYAIHIASDELILFVAKHSLNVTSKQSATLRDLADEGLIISELVDKLV
jgi:hypothetical protein